jgi:hypothetical protein
MTGDQSESKLKAFDIGYTNFSYESLKQKYLDILEP